MLTLEGVETFYGASQALFGVDLEVREGEMTALLGRNGMGKTTTIRSILALTPARRGRIVFKNRDIRRMPAHRIARLGIGLTPEGRRCFAPLTVEENLLATAHGEEAAGAWTLTRVTELFPRLGERLTQRAQTLSGGEQQMLAIGRALMTNPTLLILDEATEGLAPVIRQEIWSAIRRLKAEGQAALIVDKTLSELLPIADRAVVLERGATAWSGAASDLAGDRALQDRYLGV